MDLPDLEQTLGYLLARAGTAHRNRVERHLAAVGLHSGQVFVLFELWRRDGQRQIDLAAALGLAPPTVNKILGGLLESDLVTRAKYEDDARSTRIFLTDKGKAIRGPLEAQWAELEAETCSEFTETEALILKQLLLKLG